MQFSGLALKYVLHEAKKHEALVDAVVSNGNSEYAILDVTHKILGYAFFDEDSSLQIIFTIEPKDLPN